MMKWVYSIAVAALLPAAALSQAKNEQMKITFTTGDTVLHATLDDTSAGRDFASILPLELTLDDYHGIEKVADLGRTLDASESPAAYAPKAGDITQYAPWQNLAIFVAPFQSSRGLVRLGEFDGDFAAIKQSGKIKVLIERAD